MQLKRKSVGNLHPAPMITEISPNSGSPGDMVAFIGANLDTVVCIAFGGIASQYEIMSFDRIEALVPNGVSDGFVFAQNPGGIVYGPTFFADEDPMLGPVTTTTSTSSPGTLVLQAPGGDGIFRYELRIGAEDGSHIKSWFATAALRSDSGTVTVISDGLNELDAQISPGDDSEAAAFTISISVVGNIPQINVQDPNGHTVNWGTRYAIVQTL